MASSNSPSLTGFNDGSFDPFNFDQNSNGIVEGVQSNQTGNYTYAATYIYDADGNIIGAVSCFCNAEALLEMIEDNTLLMMTGIASALIAISFLFMEGIA